jgi:hypothetical protein
MEEKVKLITFILVMLVVLVCIWGIPTIILSSKIFLTIVFVLLSISSIDQTLKEIKKPRK